VVFFGLGWLFVPSYTLELCPDELTFKAPKLNITNISVRKRTPKNGCRTNLTGL
jgi:hypothetical protein